MRKKELDKVTERILPTVKDLIKMSKELNERVDAILSKGEDKVSDEDIYEAALTSDISKSLIMVVEEATEGLQIADRLVN